MPTRLHHARRARHDRRSLKTLDPSRDLPAPPAPPASVHVVSVNVDPEDPSDSLWTFDAPVNDPTGSAEDLTIAGIPGINWFRVAADVLAVFYGQTIHLGDPWSLPQGAAGITGTGGGTLEAGTGSVEG